MTQAVGSKYGFWLMICVALIVRLGLAVAVQYQVSKTPGRLCLIPGDAEGYWELAGKITHLASGANYSIYDPPRFLLRMPGFPTLLAIPQFFFGNNPFPARLLLAIVGTVACGLTYWLGRELGGHAVGMLASIYTTISPTMALFSVLFLSETAFAAALLASLVAAAKLVRFDPQSSTSRFVRQSLLTGFLICIATYMRPTWLLVGPGLAVLIVLFCRTSWRIRLISAVSICVGLYVTLSPWIIRNSFVTGHLIPTTLWVGPSLYDGLNPTATGDSDMTFFEEDGLLFKMSEYQMDQEYRRRAKAYAFANPDRVISLALAKQLRYWNPSPNSDQFSSASVHLIAWLAFIPLVVFSLVGAWFVRGDLWSLVLTEAPIIYFASLHLLFVGSLRYRLPAEYPLAVLAAIGIARLWNIKGTSTIASH